MNEIPKRPAWSRIMLFGGGNEPKMYGYYYIVHECIYSLYTSLSETNTFIYNYIAHNNIINRSIQYNTN